ncbi:Na/Pi cotransporter family protein [Jeongeupia naejangsanensis]|uniref:Na/Pi cotransporter family protein n=1 Tax=Jeongeupia naejangsanensis TaxID=613195 RepID=A0ABS2BPI5_9NEIS|nr:Na/Pi cotransporter family protein [Jeongeupia naejangsanensis]MBM3117478.1 Na/Pi cotransporter family protein [Jeongeupia naejangsanensis]
MMTVLLHLAGGVALLTWGLHMVETGFMRALGASLRQLMGRSLGSRWRALFAGMAITTVLQSSTATGLLATSFAARRVLTPVAGLAIMLGANLGSTLIVQAFSLHLGWVSPLCLIAGLFMFERGKGSQTRDFGRAFIGIGLMLLALRLLVETMQPAEAAPAVRAILDVLADQPLPNAVIAALLTWAAHSSIPTVLLVMSLAGSHAIPASTALAMVLGANIGSALNPWFEGNKGNDNLRRRLPAGNLLLRGGSCLILLTAVGPLAHGLSRLWPDAGALVANFHTLLNFGIALSFIGLLKPVSKLLERLFPDHRPAADQPDAPRYLDPSAIATPSLALTCATREALHMGDIVEDMLRSSMPALLGDDRQRILDITRRDNAVDRLHEAIKLYVTEITRESLSPQDAARAMAIIGFVINMEHIGDIIDKNLMELAGKKIRSQLSFSHDGAAELTRLHHEVLENFHRAQSVFISADVRTAQTLLAGKATIRELGRHAADTHLARLRDGVPESIASSSLHLDVLRDLRRIHSHICAIAYPVLEQGGAPDEGRARPNEAGKTWQGVAGRV